METAVFFSIFFGVVIICVIAYLFIEKKPKSKLPDSPDATPMPAIAEINQPSSLPEVEVSLDAAESPQNSKVFEPEITADTLPKFNGEPEVPAEKAGNIVSTIEEMGSNSNVCTQRLSGSERQK